MFTKVLRRLRSTSTKHLVVTVAFMAAMAGAIGLGLATKQKTEAAVYTPDCTANAILTCGTSDAGDFINKVNSNNGGKNADLKAIYANLGLPASDYARFASEAKPGIAYKDGRIVVDGRTVATEAWSIGRSKKAQSWNWNGYWADSAQNVFTKNEIPVMVLFDGNGEMQFYVMHACGNPGDGKKVKNSFDCNMLTKSPVQGEKDTYMFTVDAPHSEGVSIAKVEYNFGDGTTETKTDLTAVKHKFTKPGNFTVTVKVTFNLPGGKQKTVEGVRCKTLVTVLAPIYKCVQLIPTSLNDKKTQFRFTVKVMTANGATLKDVDFTLDGKDTTSGVTTKDAQGNIYKDYSFTDAVKHEIVAKVNFNLESGVVSNTCKASVTPEKQPVCEVPGKGHLPPNHPDCVENCTFPGKTHLPKGHPECGEVKAAVLPQTGMGSLLGIFAGTSAAGAALHHVVTSRRQRR